jgi:hypothetical protein
LLSIRNSDREGLDAACPVLETQPTAPAERQRRTLPVVEK